MNLPKISLVPQAIDSTRGYQVTILDHALAPVVGAYDGTEALRVDIWPGRSEPVVASPTATWVDPTNGVFKIVVTPADISGLSPETYRIAVTIAPGVQDAKAFDGVITLADAAGADAAGPVYGTFADMQAESGDWLAALQAAVDTAGYADVRAESRCWLDRTVLARIERALLDDSRLLLGPPRLYPIRRSSTIESGTWWGTAGVPAPGIESQLLQWSALLSAGALMVGSSSPDRGAATRLASLHSLFTICRRQLGKDPKNPTAYSALAAGYAADIRGLLATWNAYIDADLDGSADYIVGP